MKVFTYALKAPESRRQYPRRLKIFLDYLELEGNLQQQAEQFYIIAIDNHAWAEESSSHSSGDMGNNVYAQALASWI